MFSDSINDEIRGIRRDLAAQFGNDLDLILRISEGGKHRTVAPMCHFRHVSTRKKRTNKPMHVRTGNGLLTSGWKPRAGNC
jgi:hypothetical protein